MAAGWKQTGKRICALVMCLALLCGAAGPAAAEQAQMITNSEQEQTEQGVVCLDDGTEFVAQNGAIEVVPIGGADKEEALQAAGYVKTQNARCYQITVGNAVEVMVKGLGSADVAVLRSISGNAFEPVPSTVTDGAVCFTAQGTAMFLFVKKAEKSEAVFSLSGKHDVQLSQLFSELEIEQPVEEVKAVHFSKKDALQIEKTEDDWRLVSLSAFDTEEQLTIDFAQSEPITVIMTDAERATDPAFIVQYYAFVNTIRSVPGLSGEANALAVIDTSAAGNGGMAKLPQNGSTPTLKSIFVGQDGRIETIETLTEVYRASGYRYTQAPDLMYFNKLAENDSYQLQQVWVLKEGCDPASVNSDDWAVYAADTVSFTNRAESAAENRVYISEGAVLRLVYRGITGEYRNNSVFYDYDISNGRFYTSANLQGGTVSEQGSGTVYAYTYESGINHKDNYSGTGLRLAFGNENTGTGLYDQAWNGSTPNKYNTSGFKGCTFGLVDRLGSSGIVYSSGITAPKLFGEGAANGKTVVNGHSLKFNKEGDTYILSAVTGTGAQNLEKLSHPGAYSIWTNHFWPMDAAPSYGQSGHDPRFGSTALKSNRKFFQSAAAVGTLPQSDDGQDHNSYFGMEYGVEFTLTEDYTGPLEYCFFGDDDMWVFLDGKLICDIGGVHSSVGEYVDLWDHITLGENNTHTLRVFYAERGASGSTCYMRFTLPSVSNATTVQKTGRLKIAKQVTDLTKEEIDAIKHESGPGFMFTIHLKNSAGEPLSDAYSFARHSTVESRNLSGQTLHDGDSFDLKPDEYILISGLPVGTQYTVTEQENPLYEILPAATASGTVDSSAEREIVFQNRSKLQKIEIRKQVAGNMGETEKPFAFTVSGTVDLTNAVVTGAEHSVTENGGLSFALKDGQSVSISRVPEGAVLTVMETPVPGYETTASQGGTALTVSENGSVSVTVINGENPPIVFTNKRDMVIPAGVETETGPYIILLAMVVGSAAAAVWRRKTREA